MLIFQIKRIISSEKWFNYIVTSFFFSKMPQIWVGQTTLNGEKKEDGLNRHILLNYERLLTLLHTPRVVTCGFILLNTKHT